MLDKIYCVNKWFAVALLILIQQKQELGFVVNSISSKHYGQQMMNSVDELRGLFTLKRYMKIRCNKIM